MGFRLRQFLLLVAVFVASFTVGATKPDLFLLKTYDDSKDVVGWVMSEKLDGVRGFWDGESLKTRSGKNLNPPQWFIDGYPPFAIDGELWSRRGDFETISSIVRSTNAHDRWKQITHNIFEVPNQSGGLLERLSVLERYLASNPIPHLKILKQTKVQSQQQLKDFLQQVLNNQGEGVVVRNPDTLYQTGRLSSALKVKRYFDTECIVLDTVEGKGKYRGMMGALLCQTEDGKHVRIGSGFKDKDRVNPPSIGSKITFKYYGFTNKGNYKYPVYLRSRNE